MLTCSVPLKYGPDGMMNTVQGLPLLTAWLSSCFGEWELTGKGAGSRPCMYQKEAVSESPQKTSGQRWEEGNKPPKSAENASVWLFCHYQNNGRQIVRRQTWPPLPHKKTGHSSILLYRRRLQTAANTSHGCEWFYQTVISIIHRFLTWFQEKVFIFTVHVVLLTGYTVYDKAVVIKFIKHKFIPVF